MNLLEKKSGQATLIIIMVTLAAVVGVAATSSTQTSFSLKNTVYGVQSEQALACAEAGAEKALGIYRENDNETGGTQIIEDTLDGSDCRYETNISDYPGADGKFSIPRLSENSVIQIKISQDLSDAEIEELIPVNASYSGVIDGAIAIYVYDPVAALPKVTRRMVHCGNTSITKDFENGNFRSTEKLCGDISLGALKSGSILRIRALNNDFKVNFNGFNTGTNGMGVGNYIESTGYSGTVQRKVKVYRFYRQLPDFFDEAIAIVD
jgi:hypothetical protein